MKLYSKVEREKIQNTIKCSGVIENWGVIMTDNSPNYGMINSFQKDLKEVKQAYQENPDNVKFYKNFCYVGNKCYNGIRASMIIK